MQLDRERLIKLLNMTESDHDAEALSAIRRSNELLRHAKATWNDVVLAAPMPSTAVAESTIRTQSRGTDQFGDAPIYSGPVQGGGRNAAVKKAATARIRTVPIGWRLLFFPLWAFAETYVATVYTEKGLMQALGWLVPLVVLGFTGAVWFSLVEAVAQFASKVL
jgi:hypothetical protein